jgi:hypothetical protein
VRHDEIPALGMQAMELMAIFTEPELVDRANVTPGQRVRLAVRQQNDQLTLLRIERLGP